MPRPDPLSPEPRKALKKGRAISPTIVEAVPQRYNDFFATEGEARWFWELLSIARYGVDSPPRPFPGNRAPASPAVKGRGRKLFDALRQVDLVEYAARFTGMKPAGTGRWKGLCPLHKERTPSFHVWASPWRWRCFGACAMGGDIVDLARELKAKGIKL